jgi:SnoaL-like domain
LGTRVVEAIAAQNEAALADCFAPEAELRALVPPGFRERTGAAEAAALITAWFADSTELDLVAGIEDAVADRLHLAWRFEVVEDGTPYVVEQHLYAVVSDDRIERADVLCSGFRPRL